jgi:hypothetical protein
MKVLDRIIFYNDPSYEMTGEIISQLTRFSKKEPAEIYKYIKSKLKLWDNLKIKIANRALDMIVNGDAKFVWKEVKEHIEVEEIDEAEQEFLKKLKEKQSKPKARELPVDDLEIQEEPDEDVLKEKAEKELENMLKENASKVYVPNDLVKEVKENVKKKAGRPKKK